MSNKAFPPGPGHRIGLGFVRKFSSDPLSTISELHRNHGDIVFARMGPLRAYFFFHPDQIREILTSKMKSLPKLRLQTRVLRQWDGNGLILSEGEFWRRQRRLVQPAFQASRMAGYAESMVSKTQDMIKRWERIPKGASLDVDHEMTGLTLRIICKTLFDLDLEKEVEQIGEAVAILSSVSVREFGQIFRRPLWLPIRWVQDKKWAMNYLDEFIRMVIQDRRASGADKGDLLSMLLLAVDDENAAEKMTDEQARDEAMVLFLAGHDTTASALTWLWYSLVSHPEVEKKVVEELQRVVGERKPNFSDAANLVFLQQVIKETLRMYPPAIGIFAREAMEDIELGGYPLKKGAIVYAFSWETHRDPRWFPNPETFNPDRFSPENEKKIPPFAYFPFGGGSRVCIGASFAMLEMTLVVATVLQRYRLNLAQEKPELQALLSLRPKGGLRLSFTPRGE